MSEFTYHRASGVADAVARLAADGDARPLAGGMTLLPTIKHRLASPSQLVDIARLAPLRGIRVEDGELAAAELDQARTLAGTKFRDPDWTARVA